jgi:hypothetical protein
MVASTACAGACLRSWIASTKPATRRGTIVEQEDNIGPLAPHSPHWINKNKTHCKHGHPFDAPNTRYTKKGHRVCKACVRKVQANRKARFSENK